MAFYTAGAEEVRRATLRMVLRLRRVNVGLLWNGACEMSLWEAMCTMGDIAALQKEIAKLSVGRFGVRETLSVRGF